MKYTAIILSLVASALAGQNCKCQASSGTGPAYYEATKECCAWASGRCFPGTYFPGPNNQCSAGGTNCLNSGEFVKCCQSKGAPSAFFWG